MKKLFFLLWILTATISLHAREIHVSVSGSDANDGTFSKPYNTISHAALLAMPGDVITVHAGVYREQVTPPRGGNSDTERIVYKAAKGENVEIKGSEIVKGWQLTDNGIWVVKIPNSFFGEFNPYSDIIKGDWFWPTPKDREYHTGAVYLNGDWLMESQKKEDVFGKLHEKNLLWWSEIDSSTTTIWSQFGNADPNKETVEINVRQTIFYPEKPFINYITISGFNLQHAATNWAPPTAEQMGLIGTHWSRGWIIENNTIQYSMCAGVTLGKYGDAQDNKNCESAEGYMGTINRALAFGWNKGTIGGHIVRNNSIAYCEQSGIVGSMGCAFSSITGNTIHDIYVRRSFSGAEMAGIKFHGAIDVNIENNHIYSVNIGIWLDWMAQGAQISDNLMHDNLTDIYLEVNHGPLLVSNNILLSPDALVMNSSGAAVVHNLIGGRIYSLYYDSRLTPVHKPHSTSIENLYDNRGGDIKFYNNLFVKGSSLYQPSKSLLPVVLDGNVFTKGSILVISDTLENKFGEMNEAGKEKYQKYKPVDLVERNTIIDQGFDAELSLITANTSVFIELILNKKWYDGQKRKGVNTDLLGKAIVPDCYFENADGSSINIDTDYSGKKRKVSNPAPGPFEVRKVSKQKIKVW